MRGLLPFDGFFGDTALDHFFSDAPAVYKDYVNVPVLSSAASSM